MDTATSDIRASEFTSSCYGNSPFSPDVLNRIPKGEDIGTGAIDGAYGTRPQ